MKRRVVMGAPGSSDLTLIELTRHLLPGEGGCPMTAMLLWPDMACLSPTLPTSLDAPQNVSSSLHLFFQIHTHIPLFF